MMIKPRWRPTCSGSAMRRRAHPRASRRRGVVQRPARRMVVQRMRASQGGEGGHWAAQPRGARLAAGTGSRRARPDATCPRARVANAPGSGRPGGKERRRKQPARPRRREGGKGSGALGAQRGGWRRSANTTARGADARTAGARASASITESGGTARTAGARASANITASGAGARTAGARASASITAAGAPVRDWARVIFIS